MYHIAVDQNLAEKAQIFFSAKGMDLTEAVSAFLKNAMQEQEFTDEELTLAYDKGMRQIQEGKCVTISWADFERAANG